MTEPVIVRYEFRYTTINTGLQTTFPVGGISENVACGIKYGLQTVSEITAVTGMKIVESKEYVEIGEPPGPIEPHGQVQFHSASVVANKNQKVYSYQHTMPDEPDSALIVVGTFWTERDPAGTHVISCGGTPLESKGKTDELTTPFWVEAYALLAPPSGDQSIGWDFSAQGGNISVRMQSLVYTGVASCGAFFSSAGNDNQPALTTLGDPGHLVACVFGFDGSPVAVPSFPAQMERGKNSASTPVGIETQDGLGTFSVNLDKATGWAGAGLALVPA
jgi:hypothetical protein